MEMLSKQGTMFDPPIRIVKEIEDDLKNYHWMVVEIERQQAYLASAGEGLTQRYGLDAEGRPQGRVSDPVFREAARRLRRRERMEKLEKKVLRIESLVETSERQRAVLLYIMDGMRTGEIARHLAVTRQSIMKLRGKIVQRLAMDVYLEREKKKSFEED